MSCGLKVLIHVDFLVRKIKGAGSEILYFG
jgi:hypothetical protein